MPSESISQPIAEAIPHDIRCAQDYEIAAQATMAESSYEYVAGGTGRDLSVAANLAAFAQWSVYSRVLRDVKGGHTRVRLGSQTLAHPILLAPVAGFNEKSGIVYW